MTCGAEKTTITTNLHSPTTIILRVVDPPKLADDNEGAGMMNDSGSHDDDLQ
ncbi:hypothetical protein NQZ68_040679 [Dissostichus eleginoides]|nr:hypothetical protein NQZ68_040679 [Dissostichus eleginoides]